MVSTFFKGCKNSFWFGSTGNWGYQDNFESVYLIIYLFIYLFIYLYIYLFIYLFVFTKIGSLHGSFPEVTAKGNSNELQDL